MAQFNLVTPFKDMHGKYATGSDLSYRETLGTKHSYILQHPYKGPFSEAQNTMRHALGAATQYVAILFRDPAVKAEWTVRCEGTTYRRVDRYCISEYYKIFKSDPEQLQAALAVIAEDKQRQQREHTAKERSKALAEKALKEQQEQQDQSPTALLQRQVDILSAQLADLQLKLKQAQHS